MTKNMKNLDNNTGTTFVKPLAEWVKRTAPQIGILIGLKKFSTGQSNPTYRIQTIDNGKEERFVLRTQPVGLLLKSAHAVDREYQVMSALRPSDIPVPEMIIYCDDLTVIGVKFFIMREVNGETFFKPTLDNYNATGRSALFSAKIDLLVALAKLNPIALGLDGFGKTSGYIDRQLGTWTRQYRASETETIPGMEFLITKLPYCFESDPPGFCVIHGDFRLDNLLIQHQSHIAALLDWELSTLGPIFIDLSYWCTMLRMDAKWPIGGLGGINRVRLGIPDEGALIRAFCQKTNLNRPINWEALIAFQCFRFAAILQGVLKRHLDGNASAHNSASVGGQAKKVAALGAHTLSLYLASKH